MPHVYALLSKVRARCLIIANAAPYMISRNFGTWTR
jgi:hypothetical protein